MQRDWTSHLILLRLLAYQISQQQVSALPPVVCGLLSSLLPPLTDLAPVRAELAERLRIISDRLAWFQEAELAEVCAVLDGLHTYDPARVTGADMAALTQRLVASEANVGGPYRELDGALHVSTNAFVNQTLHWLAEPLPNVSDMLAQANRIFINKRLAPAEQTLLHVLKRKVGQPQPDHLHELHAHDWLFIAAMAAQLVYQSEHGYEADASLNAHATAVHRRVRAAVPAQKPLGNKTADMFSKVMRADTRHEIAALPWMYGQAIGYVAPRAATTLLYTQLGVANMHAWTAYTIYDDFLDEEGDPSLLATANYCLRACLCKYRTALPDIPDFQAFVEKTLTTVDAANTTETTSLRFAITPTTITIATLPPYDSLDLLADRALFHIIGPMGVLAASGQAVGGVIWNRTLQAFRHYLIARQLSDDVHDWADDLRSGQISFVVAMLLKYLGTTPGTYRLDELLAHARPVLWQGTLPTVSEVALDHITKARRIPVPKLNTFTNSHLMQLFVHVESSIQAASEQRAVGQDFLEHFTGSGSP